MNAAGARVCVCVCVCVRRASSENRRGHRGDGGNEGREIKEVTGETVDGKERSGGEESRGEDGAWRRERKSEEERALEVEEEGGNYSSSFSACLFALWTSFIEFGGCDGAALVKKKNQIVSLVIDLTWMRECFSARRRPVTAPVTHFSKGNSGARPFCDLKLHLLVIIVPYLYVLHIK